MSTAQPATVARARHAWIPALFLLAALLMLTVYVSPATGDSFNPEAFDVRIDMEPDMDDKEPNCKPAGGDMMRCTQVMSFSEIAAKKEGTVEHLTSDLKGTIRMVMDRDFRQRMTMLVPKPTDGQPGDPPDFSRVVLEEFSGKDDMSGNWFMNFDDGSSLSGVIDGKMEMGIANKDQALVYFSGDFKVEVVAGTGEFADQVGKGGWTEYDEFAIFGGPDGGPGDGPNGNPGDGDNGGPGDGPPGAHAAAKADDGAMNLRLRKGKARARIAYPGRKLSRSDSGVLRVATARGAKCVASARHGNKRVKLGRARDKNRNGEVRFRGAVARKLGKGAWKVRASCKYSSKGKTRSTAPAKRTVKVK